MKIGGLQFGERAAEKPLAISPSGTYITAKQVLAQPTLTLASLFTLSPDLQLKLAVKRYTMEPDFTLAVIGGGLYSKEEMLKHLKDQSEFGQLALRVELGYCNELMAALTSRPLPVRPIVPKVPPIQPPDWKKVKKWVLMKVKTRGVFCENTTDQVTAPMANYRIANVHPAFRSRGFTVVSLDGVNDTRAKFVPQAKSALTVYLSGVGHGSYTVYTGHWGEHILEVGLYDSAEVAGKAIHFLSCQTAAQLGPDTVNRGAKCYAGYDENFHFVWDNSTTPVNEFLLFAQADSTFDITMAKGGTAQQAYDATVQAFNAGMAQVPNSVAASWLAYDRDHLRLLGAPATKIMPYRYVKVALPVEGLEKEDALVQAGELVK